MDKDGTKTVLVEKVQQWLDQGWRVKCQMARYLWTWNERNPDYCVIERKTAK
jgi:hypothetical protein